jgi:hypothetical protein
MTGRLMKLRDFMLYRAASEKGLMEIAAKIKPLPREIGPSERFLRQTRRLLLQLQGTDGGQSQKAA